jgi:hypothetical protein
MGIGGTKSTGSVGYCELRSQPGISAERDREHVSCSLEKMTYFLIVSCQSEIAFEKV